MLEKANKIKSNDPYIIDSLGWALFKLKDIKIQKLSTTRITFNASRPNCE